LRRRAAKMPIYTLDGNIGCGKTTVLEYLHTHYNFAIDPEPVQKWKPYLEEMYHHNRGAFNFQVRVWLDRCWLQEKTNTHLIMERSPYFQANVFVPINSENGRINAGDSALLREMYEKAFRIWSPIGMIYLRSSPDQCIARIKHRGRPSENGLTEAYIRRLHEFHENAYMYGIGMGIPIICIDTDAKPVPQIAQEVANAFGILGARPAS
jgi:deoxyadenosine/deoxycytidine kinase